MDPYKMGLRPTSPTRPITPDCSRGKHLSAFSMWQKLQHFFHRDQQSQAFRATDDALWTSLDQHKLPTKKCDASSRPVGVGLPRQTTFKRQNSEKRERLCPVQQLSQERRAVSASRLNPTALVRFRSRSVPTGQSTSRSAPVLINTYAASDSQRRNDDDFQPNDPPPPPIETESPVEYDRVRPLRPASITSSSSSFDEREAYLDDRAQMQHDLDTKWILNLSMHFRDKSDREKFFVTYAETPNRWRRVTVSCDYRNAEPGSLEMDLKELQLQRDKSLQIYEAIRDSLLEIKFYDTVTNLKLETSDGRLHVHVTEDVNEIIPYPPRSSVQHILQDTDYRPREVRESELSFDAHLSGFVYRVMYQGNTFIKKEIPGPDTVDEFLYEVNALHALHDSQYVINLEAIITDDSGQFVKGLLIGYAGRGAVVDLLYDYKGDIPWEDRERWARHAVQGLSDIHEEGYVQGDFTLSNIVVDDDDNARIIDINRRGCPVGWEPPEIARKIASNQRISMYIGQKSDLYQLGMTLWALAMDDDEPERHDPPLSTQEFPSEVPEWYQDIVRICLSHRPRDRLSATDLVRMFPSSEETSLWTGRAKRPSIHVRTEKIYIDPQAAVERDDIDRLADNQNHFDEEVMYSPESSQGDYTFTWPQSSRYDREYDSTSEEIERPRGRRRVSDHDLVLQAQQHNERVSTETHDGSQLNNSIIPGISISADGTESHIIDPMDYSSEAMDVTSTTTEHRVHLPLSTPPGLATPDTVRLGMSHTGSFQGRSETSEETPRNSQAQLSRAEDYHENGDSMNHQANDVPDDLAGLGSHPNVSDNSLEHIQHRTEGEADDHLASLPPPRLSFTDSGYAEPSAFGIEEDDEMQIDEHIKQDSADRLGIIADINQHISDTSRTAVGEECDQQRLPKVTEAEECDQNEVSSSNEPTAAQQRRSLEYDEASS